VQYFNPPKEAASMGLFIDPETEKWYTGAKGPIWILAYKRAKSLLDELMNSGLTWQQIHATQDLGQAIGFALAQKYKWAFVPAFRLDGGLNKLRLLLIGIISVYIVEQWFGHHIHQAMLHNDHFGYNPQNVMNFFESGLHSGYKYMSGDLVGYDLHQQPAHLLAVYEGIQSYCNLPESVAVALYLYNAFTPAFVTVPYKVGNKVEYSLQLKKRNGDAASGIGFFATANTVGTAAIMFKVANSLAMPWEAGTYMGDNHIQPLCVGVALWIRTMRSVCGFEMDGKDTLISPNEAFYERRIFTKGTRESFPVAMSRVRNLLFPEYSDPWSMHAIRRAIVYRAQCAELLGTSDVNLLESLENIAPYALFKYDWGSDRELSQQYNQLRDQHIISTGATDDADDNLTRAMQWCNVKDSSELIDM